MTNANGFLRSVLDGASKLSKVGVQYVGLSYQIKMSKGVMCRRKQMQYATMENYTTRTYVRTVGRCNDVTM